MKPARFILNSDYATMRQTGSYEFTYTIPNEFTTPWHDASQDAGKVVLATLTKEIGNPGDIYEVYASSDRYNYHTQGITLYVRPEGAYAHDGEYLDNYDAEIYFFTYIKGNRAELEIFVVNSGIRTTYYGYGQTITIHIDTYKSPFRE